MTWDAFKYTHTQAPEIPVSLVWDQPWPVFKTLQIILVSKTGWKAPVLFPPASIQERRTPGDLCFWIWPTPAYPLPTSALGWLFVSYIENGGGEGLEAEALWTESWLMEQTKLVFTVQTTVILAANLLDGSRPVHQPNRSHSGRFCP